MKKSPFSKFLAAALCIILALGALPGTGTTAHAAGIQNGMSVLPVDTVVQYSGYQWYVIGYNMGASAAGLSGPAGTITLLAKESFGTAMYPQKPYHDTTRNQYGGSSLQSEILGGIGRMDHEAGISGLPHWQTEKIIARDLADVGVTGQNLWALSVDEANRLSENTRKFSGNWWLRSAGAEPSLPYVTDGGVVSQTNDYDAYINDDEFCIRPALFLNVSDVKMVSGVSEKRVSMGTPAAMSAPGGTLKLTFQAAGLGVSVYNNPDRFYVRQGETLTFGYTATGQDLAYDYNHSLDQYISCIIVNNGTGAKYYGHMAVLDDAAETTSTYSGTAQIQIPSDMPTGANYTIEILHEMIETSANPQHSDFTSVPMSANLTVNYPQFPAPGNPGWDTSIPGKAVWDAVTGAGEYEVELVDANHNSVVFYSTTDTWFDFTDVINAAGTGTYFFEVYAFGDQVQHDNSNWGESPLRNFTVSGPAKLLTPRDLQWLGNTTASWSAVYPASSYTVQLYKDGVDGIELLKEITGVTAENTTAQLDFAAEMAAGGTGNYYFKVKAIGDGADHLDSDYAISWDREHNAGTVALRSPANLAWDASSPGKATWDAVPQASEYHVELYKTGSPNPSFVKSHTVTGTEYDFSGDIAAAGTASYIFKLYAASYSMLYAQSGYSAFSPPYANLTKLSAPGNPAWDASSPGKAAWDAVPGASGYTVQLYKDGAALGGPVTGLTGTEYDFSAAIAAEGTGAYTFRVTAAGDGASCADSDASDASEPYGYTAPTVLPDSALIGVTTPSSVTGVANGAAKTAAALGLPSTVTLVTDNGNVQADVIWDAAGSAYDPAAAAEQTFTVNGTVSLPTGVLNPNGVPLTTGIGVTVNAKSNGGSPGDSGSSGGGSTGGGTAYQPGTLTESGEGVKLTVSGAQIAAGAQLIIASADPAADRSTFSLAVEDAKDGGRLIGCYEVSIRGGYIPPLTLAFDVGAEYDGQVITVLHDVGGWVETYTITVKDGKATVQVDSLSPFALISTGLSAPDDIVVGPPKTGGGPGLGLGQLLCGASAAGIAALAIWGKRKKAVQK